MFKALIGALVTLLTFCKQERQLLKESNALDAIQTHKGMGKWTAGNVQSAKDICVVDICNKGIEICSVDMYFNKIKNCKKKVFVTMIQMIFY
jgi:hypothetical protein